MTATLTAVRRKCGGVGSGVPGPCPAEGASEEQSSTVGKWASFAANIPIKIAKAAKAKIAQKYDQLKGRYGSKFAIAIIAAGVAGIPIPLPGSSLLTAAPVIAAAEIVRALSKSAKAEDGDVELTDEEIEQLGEEFMAEVLAEWEEENPHLFEKTDEEGKCVKCGADGDSLGSCPSIESWIKCGGVGGTPGPCPKDSAAEKEQADKLVAKFKSGEKLTAGDAKKLVESLSAMTVKQLSDFKKEHGLKASGKKADLVSKLAGRLREAEEIKAEESLPKGKDSNAVFTAESDIDQFEKVTKLPYEKAGSLVGAPDEATLTLTNAALGTAGIHIDHPAYNSYREISHDAAGKLYMANETFYMKDDVDTGKGLGSQVFADQVASARENGVAYIKCYAAKGLDASNPGNGYYTWPRMGYDQKLDDFRKQSPEERATLKEAAEKFPGAKTILDVMKTQAGRDWWKKNGCSLANMKFDLSKGSRSLKVHAAYMKERQRREEKAKP